MSIKQPSITIGSNAQYTTLLLVLLLFGLEFAKGRMKQQPIALTWQKVVAYILATVLLVAVSDVAPTLVMWFLLLLILGVLVINGDVYAVALAQLANVLQPGGKTT